jgi:hypothetical protein
MNLGHLKAVLFCNSLLEPLKGQWCETLGAEVSRLKGYQLFLVFAQLFEFFEVNLL